MKKSKKYLIAKEVAPRYRTTPTQIYEWVRQGLFPPGCVIHLNRKILFDSDSLDAFDASGGNIQAGGNGSQVAVAGGGGA